MNSINVLQGNQSIDALNYKNGLLKSNEEIKDFKLVFDEALKSKNISKLEKVAEDFEAIFIGMMFKSMHNSINSDDGIVEKSYARKVFEEMVYDEYAKDLSKRKSLGIADMIIKQYSKYI